MIDVALTKENALPYDMWGLLSLSWKPAPQDGVTVFLQGLEKRGPDNRRKRIYMSAVTPDLYAGMYQAKVVGFFDQLFSPANAAKPLMRIYLDTFWDLYWDLHLGVKGKDVPDQVRQIGENFNTVLAYRDPTQKIVYDNYMAVRKNLDFLKTWIDNRLKDIQSGKTPEPEKTFGWYWIKNGEDSEFFNHKDVVFECFHNFVAFSQWGNTLYNIMTRLGKDTGDAQTKDWFTKTMAGNFDGPDGSAFTPALDRPCHGAAVARELGLSWDTVNTIAMDATQHIVAADATRLDGVRVIGVDEHRWSHTHRPGEDGFVTVIIDLTPVVEGSGRARLLDLVPGRSAAALKTWLSAQAAAFRDQVEVVAMDGFGGYKTAATEVLPEATPVMDPFHVVALAGTKLDLCRQRIQQRPAHRWNAS